MVRMKDEVPGISPPAPASPSQEANDQAAARPANNTDKTEDQAAPSSSPRTLPQAVHAYLKQLCSPQQTGENASKEANATGPGEAGKKELTTCPALAQADNVAGERESDKA